MTPLSQNAMVQGRYLIVQMIGSGDTGEVYLAVDQWSGSAVSLKRTVVGDDGTSSDSLDRESKPLLSLRHPVLPKVNDSFVEDGQHFLVTEHISGPDLATRLEEAKKPFPLSWCMFWADQLLDALTYLHSHSPAIIHGDIKPANLKLTDENHIVLLDQGLAGSRKPAGSEIDQKSSPYSSIEQVRGQPMDAASDIYSFAATFYQLMTNVVPPDARKRADAMRSGLPDPLISLSKANPEISTDVSEVMVRGLGITPETRFAVASEMQRALRRAFKRAKEGTTARTVEFRQADEPTVEMQGQGEASGLADAVTVTDKAATDATAEVPTRTHIESAGADAVPTVQLEPARDAEPTVQLDTADAQTDLSPQSAKTETYTGENLSSAVTEVAPEPVAPQAPPATPNVEGPAASSVAAAQTLSQPRATVRTPAKKSSSRAGLVIGGLVVLLLLLGMAGAGGWYYYNNYYKAAKVPPSPSPSPDTAASPSPETETASNANTTSNSNTEQVSNANTVDSNSNKGTVASSTPTTAKPVQNAPGKTNPVRTSQPPNARPSAKPKSGDDRTVILP